jgi:hypothetical protein
MTKYGVTPTPLKTGMDLGAPEIEAAPAQLVALVVLI